MEILSSLERELYRTLRNFVISELVQTFCNLLLLFGVKNFMNHH